MRETDKNFRREMVEAGLCEDLEVSAWHSLEQRSRARSKVNFILEIMLQAGITEYVKGQLLSPFDRA